MKFQIGQVLITRGVNTKITESIEFSQFVLDSIAKYRNCIWGDLPHEDELMNNSAVKNNDDRIFGRYNSEYGDIYIITEWDRSYTTIMFTYEY